MSWREDLKVGKLRADSLFLGSGLGTEMTKTSPELNKMVEGYAAGYKLARGSVNATANATITTGLTTVVGFSLTPEADGTGTVTNACAKVDGKISDGNIVAYRWKHTGPTTPTLIAATTAGTIFWVAVGT